MRLIDARQGEFFPAGRRSKNPGMGTVPEIDIPVPGTEAGLGDLVEKSVLLESALKSGANLLIMRAVQYVFSQKSCGEKQEGVGAMEPTFRDGKDIGFSQIPPELWREIFPAEGILGWNMCFPEYQRFLPCGCGFPEIEKGEGIPDVPHGEKERARENRRRKGPFEQRLLQKRKDVPEGRLGGDQGHGPINGQDDAGAVKNGTALKNEVDKKRKGDGHFFAIPAQEGEDEAGCKKERKQGAQSLPKINDIAPIGG